MRTKNVYWYIVVVTVLIVCVCALCVDYAALSKTYYGTKVQTMPKKSQKYMHTG